MAEKPVSIDTAAQLAPNYGKSVRLVGEYFVQNLGGHAIIERGEGEKTRKRRNAAFVVVGNVSVQLPERPDEEMERLGGKRVVAVGTLHAPDAAGASGDAGPDPVPALRNVKSIESA